MQVYGILSCKLVADMEVFDRDLGSLSCSKHVENQYN